MSAAKALMCCFFWGGADCSKDHLIVQMTTCVTENLRDVWIAPVPILPGLEKASQKHRYTCLGQAKGPEPEGEDPAGIYRLYMEVS